MRNLLVEATVLSWLVTYLADTAPMLPLTGGEGPLLVTVIGLSLAGLSLILLFIRMRSGKKHKDNTINQQNNNRRVPPPNTPPGGSIR